MRSGKTFFSLFARLKHRHQQTHVSSGALRKPRVSYLINVFLCSGST